jgi:D-xylose transport system substrate-binding protein
MRLDSKRALVTMLLVGGLVASACGSSNSSSTITTTSGSSSGSGTVSVNSFTNDFSAMANLKGLAASGKGKVAVILPDTVSSARYTEFDAPYLTKAFTAAGLTSTKFSIQNAGGSDSTQLTDAQSAITSGATVLVVDPLDSGVGTSIETYAKAHGVALIDYDRLTLGGSRQYYVSFDNVKVGTLIGQGMISCVAAWKVAKPTLAVMVGSPTDNNATLFAQGYNAVLDPLFSNGTWVKAATPGWHVGSSDRPDRVPGGLYGASVDQRRPGSQ